MIPAATAESGEVRSLTKSLKLLSETLADVLKSKDSEEELQQTKIADQATLNCLEQRATLLRRRLLATARKSCLQTWQRVEKLQGLLEVLPKATSKSQEEYRTKAIPHVKELANLSSEVLSGAEALKDIQEDAATLSVAVFVHGSQQEPSRKSEGVNFKDAGGSWDVFAKTCSDVALCGKTHVSVVAALCLLATPNTSAASDDGKQLMQKLVGVQKALSKLCVDLKAQIAPGSEHFALRAFAETVLAEANDCLNPKSPDEETVAAPAKEKKRKTLDEPAAKSDKKEKTEKKSKASKPKGKRQEASEEEVELDSKKKHKKHRK